ncbi:F-box/kelch-repeat protein [Glycine soja]|uniref:F-box/kelch-repeat protein n=1 Tax=Glycine soja TaxID=3848 RepID=A0A0B2P8C2_GLYSO|nr:F-box/kelch-repeat protein [Glycine soja]
MTKRIRKDSSLPEDVEKVNNSSVELDTREGVNDGFPRAGAGANDSLLPGLFYDLALNCLAWASRSDYASLACINKRCGSVGSIVVFAGGTNKYGNVLESAELYDSNSAPPLVAIMDNQLYYDEEHLTNMVNKYDNERHTWSELGRLPVRADSSNGWGLAFKGFRNGTIDWKVLGVKEHLRVFVYNYAVMGWSGEMLLDSLSRRFAGIYNLTSLSGVLPY